MTISTLVLSHFLTFRVGIIPPFLPVSHRYSWFILVRNIPLPPVLPWVLRIVEVEEGMLRIGVFLLLRCVIPSYIGEIGTFLTLISRNNQE